MAHNMNDEIKKAGIKYLGHYNKAYIEVVGTTWRLEIPQNRLGEFTRLFPEINWEDGCFLEEIVGKYVRVTTDDEMKIYALHHIVKNIDYFVNSQ